MQLPITDTLVLKARAIRCRRELGSNIGVIISLIGATHKLHLEVRVAVTVVLGTELVGEGNVEVLDSAACAEVFALGDEVGGGAPVDAVGPGVDFGFLGGDSGSFCQRHATKIEGLVVRT